MDDSAVGLFGFGFAMSVFGVMKDEWLGRAPAPGGHLMCGVGFFACAAATHCPLFLMFPVFYFFELLGDWRRG